MRQPIKDLVSLFAREFTTSSPVYEFGAFQVEGQVGFADLRPLFPDADYVGADMREGPGVDKILNLHQIDLPDESVGTVICLDTLEHVEHPRTAMREIHRILKPESIVLISSVMNFPIHDYPYDYWRFTPEAFRSILSPFDSCFVGYSGEEIFPHTVFGIGFKGISPDLTRFETAYKEWQKTDANPIAGPEETKRIPASGFTRIRRLITPPILSRSGRKALGLEKNRGS